MSFGWIIPRNAESKIGYFLFWIILSAYHNQFNKTNELNTPIDNIMTRKYLMEPWPSASNPNLNFENIFPLD